MNTLKNTILQLLLLVPLALVVRAQTQREGVHIQDIPTGGSYDPIPNYDQNQYEFKAPHPSYSGFSNGYPIDHGYGVGTSHGYGNSLSDWNNFWGIKWLKGALPIGIASVGILLVLALFGLVKVPVFDVFDKLKDDKLLVRAFANTDMDQIYNGVQLAIQKYQEMFPEE